MCWKVCVPKMGRKGYLRLSLFFFQFRLRSVLFIWILAITLGIYLGAKGNMKAVDSRKTVLQGTEDSRCEPRGRSRASQKTQEMPGDLQGSSCILCQLLWMWFNLRIRERSGRKWRHRRQEDFYHLTEVQYPQSPKMQPFSFVILPPPPGTGRAENGV